MNLLTKGAAKEVTIWNVVSLSESITVQMFVDLMKMLLCRFLKR